MVALLWLQLRDRADSVRREYEDQLDQMQTTLDDRDDGIQWKNTVSNAMQKLDQL